ncbi:hypothetical protein MUK42_13577 [Musa troglodytarum]|uniref:Uncharacterized protein n=1 Tax=Musa troglodytarum TaxID=320322 RepID=A0A9E7ID08_9LILI|nr:hypothetical protein MUK42_13577 [Musa troglodytarum]
MQHHALGTGKCRSWEYILWILSSLMYDLDLPGMSSSGTQSTLYGAISYDDVELQICNRSLVDLFSPIHIMGDSTTMTIEFLRARLLSERTVSKAAKERAEQLATRVMELEEQLRIVSIQRRKAEQAATEAISILEIHGSNDLSAVVDSSSDKDGSPCDGKDCDEAFKEDEASTAPKGERLEVEDARSTSEHEVSPSQVGSLSWKSHSSSPDFTRKLKGKQFRSKQRRISLRLSVETSPKYNLGKSCRKIKRKEMRSTAEDKGDYHHILDDHKPELSGNVSERQSSFVDVQEKEADGSRYAIASERDEEMERVLKEQAKLIGQYEDEEKAQREWEQKYNENKASNMEHFEPGKQCHAAEINMKSQKESSAFFDRIAYEEAKSSICAFSRTIIPGCLSDDPLLGDKDVNIVEFSDAIVPTDLPVCGIGSDSQACVDGNHVAENNNEGLVVVAFPTKVSTVSTPLGKVNQNSDSGSSSNINLHAHNHINSSSTGSPSTADPVRERPKWESSATHDLSYMKQSPSAATSLGGVLEALQHAKNSLRQELHKLPLPDPAIRPLPAPSNYHVRAVVSDESSKVPVGSVGLFRIPIDHSHQSQNSEQEFHGSGLSLAAGHPHLGYAITTSDLRGSIIPCVSKESMDILKFDNYLPGMDLPSPLLCSQPCSGSMADKIHFPNEIGVSLGKQHFNTYSRGIGIPAFNRCSLPSDLRTSFPSRSGSSTHKQYFDSCLGSQEPPLSTYPFAYSGLTTNKMLVHDGLPKPYTYTRNRMPSYGGDGSGKWDLI